MANGSFYSKKNVTINRGGSLGQSSVASAYATGQKSQAPRIVASRDKSRIVHRELIANVSGAATAAFTNALSFALNPGLSASFPWLSTQAQAWETYRFNKLRFCYYTRTGSTTVGSLQLVPDYDASDPAPTSEQIASSYEDVVEDVPWKDLCCDLRPSAMHSMGPKKFIRTGPAPAGTDIKNYDCGNLFVDTVDSAGAASWGKLWVEYDVDLYTPQLTPSGAGVSSSQHLQGATPTTANMLGAAPTTVANSSPLVTVVGQVITFNVAGRFLVVYNAAAGSLTSSANPAVGAGNKFVTSYGSGYNGIGASTGYALDGSAGADYAISALVDTVIGGTLTFATTVVGGSAAELFVVSVPTGQA